MKMGYSQKKYVLIFLIILQDLWTLSDAKDKVKAIPGVKITCDNDENCEHIMGSGSECIDHNCECRNETCSPTSNLRSKVNAIGEQCGSNSDCNIEDANCIDGYCVCSRNQVPSNNNRICLTVSEGLGNYCEEDVQCISAINNAICRDNKCICNNMTHEAQYKCWKNIGLKGLCIHNNDCSHIKLSHCGTMFCECQTGYVASEKQDECLPVVVEPDQVCEQNAQCSFIYGHGGICRYNECQCDPVHRFVNDKCPSNLKKYCDDDLGCKMHNEDFSIHCDENRCECLPPFIEENGRCSDTASINKMNNSFLSMVSLVILWKFF